MISLLVKKSRFAKRMSGARRSELFPSVMETITFMVSNSMCNPLFWVFEKSY
jgi:hypothetical protein